MVAAVALALAGCAQPEDRINAALPPNADIVDAHARLVATAQQQHVDVAPIQGEYAQRLRMRARECSHGYWPGPLTREATIRETLTDSECFMTRDGQLQQWLVWRRVGLLLAAPPLRPVPKSPPTLATTSAVRRAEFAAQAGVVLVQTLDGHQVFDLGTGTPVHRGTDGDNVQGLSPNGALFLAEMAGTLQLRASVDGEVVASLPDVPASAFHWVHDVGAVYSRPQPGTRRAGPMMFVDLRGGRESSLPMAATRIDRVVPMPGAAGRFALVSDSRVAELELRPQAQGLRAALLSERVLPSAGFSDRGTPVTDDGLRLVGLRGGLQVLDMATLKLRSIPLTPFRPEAVVLTPDPDVLLLAGYFPDAGFRAERYLYSTTRQTLARVDDARLPSPHVMYVPALRRNAVIIDRTIAMLDTLPAGPPVAAETLLNGRQAMAFALAREQALLMPQVARARLARSRELDAQARSAAGATGQAGSTP